MKVRKSHNNRKAESFLKTFASILFLLYGTQAYSDVSWMSATLDNDFFVGEDNGYTNGIYVSKYNVYDGSYSQHEADIWVKPLMWSMPNRSIDRAVNVYSFGQTLTTPYDISQAIPSESDLPYSAVISFTNTYISAGPSYADRVSTTLGIVGPLALGEESQKAIHSIISAQEPKGWDTQLNNELVFEFSRGRIWREWISDSGHADILLGGNIGLGTLSSSVSTAAVFRYGKNLESSYATALFADSRTSNPIAVNGGWFVYSGLALKYYFNQIYTDGNTFSDSRSIDYDHNINILALGVTYSWGNSSLAFAINTPFSLQYNGSSDHRLDDFNSYGTLTFAWQI
ncbi:lipid A deacylase LpxR family protein [Marinomonas sp. 2405UD66-6]|uniref:lipid A deacylase LpxR family protein n=1 Tax=Marinomonas sp. 2405UD66-6 TaxID=3391834 RepID=UPI0039C905C0